jgi:hypothetical protein
VRLTRGPPKVASENRAHAPPYAKRSATSAPTSKERIRPPSPPPIEPLVVRPAQAARLLAMSERTIWTHIAQGRLKVSRVGNITLVHMISIRALLGEPSPVHTP